MGQVTITGLVRLLVVLAIVTSRGAADEIAYGNVAPGVAYIGSRACAGCHQKMYQHLARAIELGFTAPAVFEDLAEATARAGRTDESIKALQRGIELNPILPHYTSH
jgi:hypothetical protein